MRALPALLQPLLTWLVGKPLAGERPWCLGPWHHLGASIVPLAAGTTMSALAVVAGGWWLLVLPVSWLLTVHGARKLRTMILHQCSHGNFLRRKAPDTVIGQLIAVALVTQEFEEYRREHVVDHHSSSHMTLDDPTVQFLIIGMGARAGMSRQMLWHRLGATLISPPFHVKATYARIASHFRGTSTAHRLVLVSFLVTVAGIVMVSGTWLPFLVAWIVPLTVLFNAAAALRLSSRHVFPSPGPRLSGRAALASYTHGVFLGERAPDSSLPPARRLTLWVRWWARMLLVHLPSRLFVFVGDGPCHDYHHRYPRSRDWANYIFARQQDMARGHPGWPAYTEVWGLHAAIDAVFVSLSQADVDAYDPAQVTSASPGELLAAFEE